MLQDVPAVISEHSSGIRAERKKSRKGYFTCKMNYGAIKKFDIANGTGVRVSLFVSGCTHHCKECFQPETWDLNYGNRFTKAVEDEIIEALSPDYIQGLSLLGGEPFEPENQIVLYPFLQKVKQSFPDKTVRCYSGYTFEQILSDSRAATDISKDMLSLIDILVDGEFMIDLKNISLAFRGSSNQRIIDVRQSLKKGEIVIHMN